MRTDGFKVGDVVKLRPGTTKIERGGPNDRPKTTIRAFLSGVEGGVLLDDRMGGFRYWNVEDLLPADKDSPQ